MVVENVVVVVFVIALLVWCGGGRCERKVVETQWWAHHELCHHVCRASCSHCHVSMHAKAIDSSIEVTVIALWVVGDEYYVVPTTNTNCLGLLLGSFSAVANLGFAFSANFCKPL